MSETKQIVGVQNYTYPRIRVSKKAYDAIARCANESDKTMNEIASALIEYAINHLSIREEMVPVTKVYIGEEEVQ
ncbi:hypothetical protein NHG34_05340 [Aerococcaceae bacterium NML190938]|nr:hypothetical protein [Aerococcaceae bacterium NML190938]